MARDLHGKVIAITGAGTGIGAATAIHCARAGMDISLAGRRKEKLDEAAGEIQKLGRRALAVTCDVQRDEDVERFITDTLAHFGRLDAVFANAGYGLYAAVLDTTEQQHRDIFETNYWGTVRVLRYGVPALRAQRDGLRHVLICSSAASEIGIPMFGAYSATKAAQDSIACALRGELASEEIAVTSVHPVATDTPFFEQAGRSKGPVRTAQAADDVARAIIKALRRPKAEVWPKPGVRFGLAITTALPGVTAWYLKRYARRMQHRS